MVVDEEIHPDNVECFECLEKAEKCYINVINYYYYYMEIKNVLMDLFWSDLIFPVCGQFQLHVGLKGSLCSTHLRTQCSF